LIVPSLSTYRQPGSLTGKPHLDGDLRRNRSGGETGFVYFAMIYIGRTQ